MSPTSFYARVIHNLPDMAALHRPDGAFRWVSPAAGRLLGRRPPHLVGTYPWHLADDATEQFRVERFFSELLAGKRCEGLITFRCAHDDGHLVWLELAARALPIYRTGEYNVHSLFRDVEARKSREEEVRREAMLDPLTRLPNRTLFMEQLRKAVARARNSRAGQPLVSVIFVDIDDFKAVNDTHGHLVGDAVLRMMAERLRHSLRPEDTVSRFGGDEFVVLLDRLAAAEQGVRVAERVRENLSRPFHFQRDGESRLSLSLSASMGMATTAPAGRIGAEDLLHLADTAMYRAKAAETKGGLVHTTTIPSL